MKLMIKGHQISFRCTYEDISYLYRTGSYTDSNTRRTEI